MKFAVTLIAFLVLFILLYAMSKKIGMNLVQDVEVLPGILG